MGVSSYLIVENEAQVRKLMAESVELFLKQNPNRFEWMPGLGDGEVQAMIDIVCRKAHKKTVNVDFLCENEFGSRFLFRIPDDFVKNFSNLSKSDLKSISVDLFHQLGENQKAIIRPRDTKIWLNRFYSIAQKSFSQNESLFLFVGL